MISHRPRQWARRLRPVVTRPWFLVTAAVLVVLFAAYTLAGFFLVPRLIRTYVPQYAQEQLERRAEIGEVRVNPLLFKVEIKNFQLQEADGRPIASFERLFVDFEITSLLRAAWTFAEIQLEAPRLDAVLGPDGRLNLAALADRLPRAEPAPEPAEPSAPPRVLLQHAVLRGGAVAFTDLSQRAPQTVTVQPIDIELHDVTTLRERRGPYTIAATLSGGGVVSWDGEVSLVPLRSSGRLDLRGFPLSTAWRFVQEQIALAEPAGKLDANLRYQFAYRDGATSMTVEGVEVALSNLVLAQRGEKAPLLALEKIDLTAGFGDLVTRDVTVPEISVSRGRVAAVLAKDGTLNWQRLVAAAPPTSEAPAAAAEVRPWRLGVERLRIDDVALAFVDESRRAPLAVDVGGLTLALAARLESGADGVVGTVSDLGLKLAKVAVRGGAAGGPPVVALEQVAVDGGRLDLGARQVTVSRVGVNGGTTTIVREGDGSLPLVTMLSPVAPAGPAAPRARPPASAPAAVARPWTVSLGSLDVADHRIAVADRSVTPAGAVEIESLRAGLREYRSDGKKPVPFTASFRVKQGGRFTAKGQVTPDGRTADATLALTQLALTPAQPYIAQNAAVVLSSGDVSTTGRLRYRAGPERAVVTYAGSADVDRVVVLEAATNEPVLSWKSLHADKLRFGLTPDRLDVGEVRLAGLDGNVVIARDKTLNLLKLMKPAEAAKAAGAATTPAPTPAAGVATPAADAPAAAPNPAPETASPPKPAAFPVGVERVRIDESSMSFADLSLVLPFATRVHSLQGVVAGVGTDPAGRATVKLDGRVDEYGSVKIEGALSSFQPKVFTDLAVIFRNVPMSSLSPYSATFAGRRIRAGTLDLDLGYKIDRGELVGENKVLLQELQLGERVESPGAMRLPLDLAIAILSDSQGRIDLALPVRGNVDHPEFSYGHLIWQALVTVVTKIATSPFRALAGLVGGDAETVGSVAFEAGSDRVPPPERQKLKRVAEVLDKRPRLKVTVHGRYDANVDGEALRSLHVRQDLARQLEVTLQPGEDPGPVAFDQAKTQRALEALLTRRAGDKAVDEFQARYEKSTGRKAERANPLLAFVGRGSPDRAFYEALFRRLVELAPLAEGELTALATRRAEAAARALKEGAAAAAARVEVGDTEAADRAERNAIPTRLELGAVGS
jgi:uncharacterized protein involved in outer membrane biogenesis